MTTQEGERNGRMFNRLKKTHKKMEMKIYGELARGSLRTEKLKFNLEASRPPSYKQLSLRWS